MNAYEQLAAQVEPTLKHYKEDLTRHDREFIANHPNTPFLHFTREMGTHIYMLSDASEYPAAGVRVPYIFATADREHILNEIKNMVNYHNNPMNAEGVWRYFDGKTVKTITPARASAIADEYTNHIRAQWRKA